MTMPLYASPEQLMRDRSEYARKGIARGRSVVALKYAGGVLFVADNPSATLHKVSEIYHRIGFAATGRYSEFDGLRRGGIRHVDLWGLANDPRDVSARLLVNVYAQTLASVFADQLKPYEVELCIGEVGATPEADRLYRLTYDGSIVDEPSYLVMGGQTEPVSNKMKETYEEGMSLEAALGFAVAALSAGSAGSASGNGDNGVGKLEVAVLDRARPKRAFRRIEGAALTALLPSVSSESTEGSAEKSDSESPGADEA
ncbi:proteasome subunit alpha [Actinophytocola sp.]|uniref:proteasome subunit alpha n=1 Tax=Actinophytocola sp. TaxID=1872138 RepID=UPI002ED61D07